MLKISKKIKSVGNIIITTTTLDLFGRTFTRKIIRSKYAVDFPYWAIILFFLVFLTFLLCMLPDFINSQSGFVAFTILMSAIAFTIGHGMNKLFN